MTANSFRKYEKAIQWIADNDAHHDAMKMLSALSGVPLSMIIKQVASIQAEEERILRAIQSAAGDAPPTIHKIATEIGRGWCATEATLRKIAKKGHIELVRHRRGSVHVVEK